MKRPALEIMADVKDQIMSYAREACADERMGLLASKSGSDSGVIVGACLLPASASRSHAEATPLAIQQAAERLRASFLVPSGLWHSHGAHAVFHSALDDDTVSRLLPAMAEWNFERSRPRHLAPVVTAPDEAVLPLPDGQALHFMLLGPEVPEFEAHQRARWGGITISFGGVGKAPCAVHNADFLRLNGGGVTLTLGLPQGTSLTSRIDDIAPLRVAHLYSLVVNNRGDEYAEAMTVLEFDDQSIIQKGSCQIVVVQNSCSSRGAECRPFIAGRYRAAAGEAGLFRGGL
jgi:hypothetical protein